MSFKTNAITNTDFYKIGHVFQYPKGTTKVYSNLTARSDKHTICKDSPYYDNKIVFFGLQYFIKNYLLEQFNETFFNEPLDLVLDAYKRRMDTSLGKGAISMEHIVALHNLGYLPIKIKALPEGTRIPMRIPMLTITNTLPEFYWVTNFLETTLSCVLWKLCNNATIAYEYKRLLNKYSNQTCDDNSFVQFQGHDFSFRGMSGIEDACSSGMGHLLSFVGTDTIPAIDMLEHYYGANSETELVGCSVPATEHSVMCSGGKETELDTFRRLITEVYPTGIVSIVSDTWDFWKVIGEYAKELKPVIETREGKVVFRPDSGNPMYIICGCTDEDCEGCFYPKDCGAMQALWDIYGGTVNSKGYKVLNPKVGLIYGDSITIDIARRILEGLERKGFASSNIVFGIGSYTYNYNTRDSFGMAVKSTYVEINGQAYDIEKDPITGDGIKKSACGLLRVNEDLSLTDRCTPEQENEGLLTTVFENGKIIQETKLSEIRARL